MDPRWTSILTSHLHPVTQMFVTSNLIPNAAVPPDRCPSHENAMTQVNTSFIQTNAISQGCTPSSPPYNIISNHCNHPLPTSPIPESFTAAASDAATSTAEVTSASNAAASLAHASPLPPVQPHWHPFLVAAGQPGYQPIQQIRSGPFSGPICKNYITLKLIERRFRINRSPEMNSSI